MNDTGRTIRIISLILFWIMIAALFTLEFVSFTILLRTDTTTMSILTSYVIYTVIIDIIALPFLLLWLFIIKGFSELVDNSHTLVRLKKKEIEHAHFIE